MTFIHEIIPEDDKRSIDFTKISGRFKHRSKPSQWIIDRSQDAILLWLYPNREPPHEEFYALSIRGVVFNIAVLDIESKKPDGKLTLVRKIVRLTAANSSVGLDDVQKALSLAKEALLAGAKWDRSTYASNTDEIRVESEI